MPASVQTIITPTLEKISVALEPANNGLHSLMLLLKADKLQGLDPWVDGTLQKMSTAELQTHNLVLIGLHYAVFPERSWPSFPAYLERLETIDPLILRDRMLEIYFNMPCQDEEKNGHVDQEMVLRSAESYIRFLESRFGADLVDPDLETQAYTYVINPTAMKRLIASHMRHMWEKYLADEWARVEPMLNASVRAFQEIDLQQMTRLEAAEFVTGQDVAKERWVHWLEKSQRLVFMPSAHVGPYFGQFKQGETMGLVFGARLPEGSTVSAPDLSRQEIVVRLSALADDTRLQIMQLIYEEGELNSQEIMHTLSLSQSAASRHLKQLSANGLLSERRCDGAKCYSLNEERIGSTLQALAVFLTGTPFP